MAAGHSGQPAGPAKPKNKIETQHRYGTVNILKSNEKKYFFLSLPATEQQYCRNYNSRLQQIKTCGMWYIEMNCK
jgi:hypothetical protein